MSGGLARTSTAVSDLRSRYPHVVLADAGGFSPPVEQRLSGIISKVTMDVMEKLNYDVINIDSNDVFFAKKSLRDPAMVSANIMYKGTGQPVRPLYRIVEKNGVKIGITGIAPGPGDANITFNSRYETATPANVLEKIIPGLREKADLVILLSGYPYKATRTITESVTGIDIAVTNRLRSGEKPAHYPDDRMLEFGKYCSSLDFAVLTIDARKRLVSVSKDRIELDSAWIEPDPEIAALTDSEEMKKHFKQFKEANREKVQKEHEELSKLSPEEYVEMLLQKQKQEKQGE